jgi:hypothetical protein
MFNSTNCGYSLADIAAATGGGRNSGGFGDGFGDGGWWIILLFLFAGWGGRGVGGVGGGYGGDVGGGGAGIPHYFMGSCATKDDVRAAVDQQTLISKLDQQTYGLADSTYALNNTITNGFHGVDNAICTLGYNIQNGFNTLGYQQKDCCCETQRLIERNFCDLGNAICNQTRDIIDNQNANYRGIMDFMVQSKLDALRSENEALRLSASQAKQNQYLIDQLRPCPVPAYITCNPYAASWGVGYGNSGCGCGCA